MKGLAFPQRQHAKASAPEHNDLCMGFRFGMLLWGLVIYSLSVLAWSFIFEFEIADGVFADMIGYVTLAFASFAGGKLLNARNAFEIAPYALSWVLIVVVVGAVLNLRYTGIELFFSVETLIGYALIFVAPFFALYPHVGRSTPSSSTGTQ